MISESDSGSEKDDANDDRDYTIARSIHHGGNPLQRPALSHQKLVRSCCWRTTLTSSFVVESTSLPCLLSMNGENFSDSFLSFSFSLYTGLLPCGAFEPAMLVVILPPFLALTTQPLQLKLTFYPRRTPSLIDLNSRPPLKPLDPPDRATPSQSKTFTVIVPFVLILLDPKNLLVLSVSHSSLVPACDVVNLLVSTILKPMTLEVFVVSLDGLSFTIAGSSVTSPIPLSTIYVNPATDVGETPLRRPDLFLKRLRRQSSSSDISLPSSIISIPHVWPPPPFRSFKRGGNPLRRPALSHLFVNLASDVGGNSLRRLALSHQNLVRTCCRRTTLTSSFVVESTSLPCLLSMNGENFSDFFQSYSFSLFIGLLSCGAVSMGSEDPPDPPDQATPSQSKTFTVIVPFVLQLELVLVDSKNLLVLSVSHSSLVHVCDFVNFLVSTILKSRTPEGFVVSLDGLSFTRTGSSVTSPVPLSTISVNPATDVGETPVRRPDMFLKRLKRQSSSSDISLPSSIISISHVWPPPPFTSFKRGNPLRRPALSHLFVNLAYDVGGNPLRRQALSHQKLCHCGSLHPRDTFSDQFESATLVVILPPYPALTTQSLQLKLTFYPRRASSPSDLNSRPPPEIPDPPDPPDRATPSQSKTFTVIMPFVL
ncbi:hypothetical protein F2Q68_00008415 [Brassica cretica]|uniref:Uncharacterized protein n=1 Tax=Brassica cretica TaxID=69181 RepID=A0A8S9L1C4_BRACR|nr:hypothetical protein F2Q68_00008415 [Brassica cretica]